MHWISGTEKKTQVSLRVRWAAILLSAAGFSLGLVVMVSDLWRPSVEILLGALLWGIAGFSLDILLAGSDRRGEFRRRGRAAGGWGLAAVLFVVLYRALAALIATSMWGQDPFRIIAALLLPGFFLGVASARLYGGRGADRELRKAVFLGATWSFTFAVAAYVGILLLYLGGLPSIVGHLPPLALWLPAGLVTGLLVVGVCLVTTRELRESNGFEEERASASGV